MDLHGGNIYRFKREGKEKLLDYSSNINPFGISERVKEIILRNFEEIERYPDIDYVELREAIAQYNDCDKDRNVSFVGKVGLMYPSDYMYAVDLGLCTVSSSEYNSDSCIGSNWLSLEDEFTITPSINNSSDVVSIRDGVVGVGTSNLKNRPVLYLKSSVSIVSGNGTEDNPYNLEIVD